MSDYRQSHASEGYGECYSRTYTDGFYYHQWMLLERPLLRRCLAVLREAGARSCLDFACGTGRITRVAEEFFSPVVGVDVSQTMLDQAREQVASARLIRQDITKENLGELFDVCTAFRFFLNAEDTLRRDALRGIREHLADGGALVANIHVNSRSLLGAAYRFRNWMKRRTVANVESYQGFERLLRENGFLVESLSWYSYLPRIGWFFPDPAKHLMVAVEHAAQRIPLVPDSCAQAFLVVARKGQAAARHAGP